MRTEQEISEASNDNPYGEGTRYVPYSPASSEKTEKTEKTAPPIWIILLALLGMFVGLPIIVGLLSVPLTLLMGAVSVLISLLFAGFALVLGGLTSLASVPLLLTTDFGTGVFTGGMGLVSVGFGILIVVLFSRLASLFLKYLRKGFWWIVGLFRKKNVKIEVNGNEQQRRNP